MKAGLLNSTGMGEPADKVELLRVYPNPFHDFVRFSDLNHDRNITEVNIYNVEGQIVISLPGETNPINTASLNTGIYLMEFIYNDHSRVYKKIVKFEVGE